MLAHLSQVSIERIGIALVDGDAAVRRNRQLMLSAENFNVRSYATCAAMIADPNARSSACLVVDVDMPEMGGVDLLRQMRSVGWNGSGILLQTSGSDDMSVRAAKASGDTLLPNTIADQPLLDAIRLTLQREHHGGVLGAKDAA
jgi:FixJ family two-component response regulator